MKPEAIYGQFALSFCYWLLYLFCNMSVAHGSSLGSAIYQDDPTIVSAIAKLGDNQSIYLPMVKVDGKVFSPKHRDFSNKMPWAADRKTALYAGGSHQTYRANDVWEFHLGSNRWHRLFAADGGNHAFLKYTLYSGAVKKWRKDLNAKLSQKDQDKFTKAKRWWHKNIVLKDGHITTQAGGPIMPSHTWDAFTYDSRTKKLIWGNGAHPGGSAFYHAMLSGSPLEQVRSQIDSSYTPMWMFDLTRKSWIHYKTSGPRPTFRGMGATMQYLADIGQSIWYVAAKNVNPHAFEMWKFDALADEWAQLKPNGGKSIYTLAVVEGSAPLAEQQVAYDQQSKTLVAVRGSEAFTYKVDTNTWTKVATDKRIDAHDAKSVFAFDEKNHLFLLANPKHSVPLAAFSLKTNQWQPITPDGPAVPNKKHGPPRGYYDPKFNVFVIDDSKGQIWLYRYKK